MGGDCYKQTLIGDSKLKGPLMGIFWWGRPHCRKRYSPKEALENQTSSQKFKKTFLEMGRDLYKQALSGDYKTQEPLMDIFR